MLRNIKETRILKAIVHILDNEEDIKIFNDFELEMGEKKKNKYIINYTHY